MDEVNEEKLAVPEICAQGTFFKSTMSFCYSITAQMPLLSTPFLLSLLFARIRLMSFDKVVTESCLQPINFSSTQLVQQTCHPLCDRHTFPRQSAPS